MPWRGSDLLTPWSCPRPERPQMPDRPGDIHKNPLDVEAQRHKLGMNPTTDISVPMRGEDSHMSRLLKHRRTLLRLAPVLALSALTMLHPASVTMGQSAGRGFARCIVECNSARRECRRSCRSSCGDVFGHGNDARVCKRACFAECGDIRKICRENCKVIKPPPSNPVP